MSQCPFLSGRSTWREDADNPLLKSYAHNMKLLLPMMAGRIVMPRGLGILKP